MKFFETPEKKTLYENIVEKARKYWFNPLPDDIF